MFPMNGRKEIDDNCNSLSLLDNCFCYICNGFYGPNFEDPLCATCHAFLYPNTVQMSSMKYELSSDSDSGNEELDDGADSVLSSLSGDDIELLTRTVTIFECHEALAKQLKQLSEFSSRFEYFNIELLPTEVLMHTFKYLDEISLWAIGQVCTRFREILFMCVKPERWKSYTISRWPLLPTDNSDKDWYEIYTRMMLSSCCKTCIKHISAQDMSINNWNESSWRRNRLKSELRAIQNDPLDGIQAQPLDLMCGHWQATIEGPTGSPYEGGLFFLYIQVPHNYPLCPPIVRFITKVFHPNVSRHGDIGIDSIYHNWSLALTLSKLLISIQSLLTDPYCDVCMESEIGALYKRNRILFDKLAGEWTKQYAMCHRQSSNNGSC